MPLTEEEWAKVREVFKISPRVKKYIAIGILLFILLCVIPVTCIFHIIPAYYGHYLVTCEVGWCPIGQLDYYGNPLHTPMVMDVIIHNNAPSFMTMGRIKFPWNGSCDFIYPHEVKIVNTYFTSVTIRYNGLEHVILIYNRTVNDPADVEANRKFLVWGAFNARWVEWPRIFLIFEDENALKCYILRRSLINHSITIGPKATIRYYMWCEPYTSFAKENAWHGQDINGNPVSPGTYYIYMFVYGIPAKPFPLVVTIRVIHTSGNEYVEEVWGDP